MKLCHNFEVEVVWLCHAVVMNGVILYQGNLKFHKSRKKFILITAWFDNK